MNRTLRILRPVALAWTAIFLIAFVVVPLGVMLWETVSGPDGFTLEAWGEILASPIDREQIGYSMLVGAASVAVSLVFGLGHALLTHRTDLPGAAVLAPLGVLPLVVPPILVAMGFADFMPTSGFWACAFLLGTAYAPFVTVLAVRGLRSLDGRSYEAALLARGRGPAEWLLLRSIRPEVAAGCLFAFVFVISDRGVPEFLTVKGKAWHTYAEGVFARWSRRLTGQEFTDLVSPIVAAVPLVVIILVALWMALRFRARSEMRSDLRPLPVRRLGIWRWPALLLPLTYLTCGVAVPIFVMGRWAMGSTQSIEPMSLDILRRSFQRAVTQSGEDLSATVLLGCGTVLMLIPVAVVLARTSARTWRGVDLLSILPLAVPSIVLAIGFVKTFNNAPAGAVYDAMGFDVYDSQVVVAAAYAARLLPFGVLTLSHATRRIPVAVDEAALLSGRPAAARAWAVHLPMLLPAVWSASILIFVLAIRELDIATVLPGGNGTVVRRLSNIVHFGGEDTGGAMALMLIVVACLVPTLTVLITGRKLRSIS